MAEVSKVQKKTNVSVVFRKDKKEDPENRKWVSFISEPGKILEEILI